MATIKTVTVKGWVYNDNIDYSVELVIDYDWQKLDAVQVSAIAEQANQQKGIIENLLMGWKNGPMGDFKSETTVPQKTITPLDRAVVKSDDDDVPPCSICKGPLEKKMGKNGKPHCYCASCRDNRMMTGYPFPMRGSK